MALTLTSNLTLLVDCESTSNWSGDPTLTTDSTNFKEGSNSVGVNVDIETLTIKCDLTSERGATQNLTNTCIYFWVLHLVPGNLDTWSAGGLRLYLEDGSGNYSEWSVTGGDEYEGGWRRYCVDTSTTPDYVSGTLSISAVAEIGITCKGTAKFKATEEYYCDYFAYHANNTYAYTITGGASGDKDFEELASQDASSGYGLFVKNLEGNGYIINGPIRWNDTGTSALTFEDTNQVIFTPNCWRSFTTTNRTSAESFVGSDQFEQTITGNGTGATSVTFGAKSGTRGITGCVFKCHNTNDPSLKFTADSNVNTLKWYGTSFIDCGTFTFPVTSANREVIDCNFIGCDVVTTSTMIFTYCNWISAVDDAITISSATFNVTYSNIIDPGVSGINVTADVDVDFTGITFSGTDGVSTYDVENSQANAIEINNLGSPRSNTQYKNENPGTITINTSVNVSATCKNKAGNAVQGIKCRVETDPGGVLIVEGSTNASGVFTDTWNWTGDTAAKFVARLKGYEEVGAFATLTTDDINIPFTMIRSVTNLP